MLGVDTGTVERVCTTLMRAGFAVETAYSAEEALAHLRGIKPDVLVADLALPRDQSVRLMRAIIDDAALSNMKVVGLTPTPGAQGGTSAGLAVICDEQLPTSLDPARLGHRVREALRRRREAGEATLASWGLS
ncbi:MAG: hypothetical protein ACREPI_12950 [Candidatus Dormibacterales bacterium]